MGREEFEALVTAALDGVPEPFASALRNVAVVVEDRSPPGDPDLFGLYIGIPPTHGDLPSGALPPRVAIYMHPMLDYCETREELAHEVRVTVLHELGHALGMGEDRLRQLGYG